MQNILTRRHQVSNFVREILSKKTRDNNFDIYVDNLRIKYSNSPYILVENISRNNEVITESYEVEYRNIFALNSFTTCDFCNTDIESRLSCIFFDNITYEPILMKLLYFFKPDEMIMSDLRKTILKLNLKIDSVVELGIKEVVEVKEILIELSKVVVERKEA